jgi:hypothetical protein
MNRTAYLIEYNKNRTESNNGIHAILKFGYNQYIYSIAFTLMFAVMYSLINKLVYRITSHVYFHELCVQKYKLRKLKSLQKKQQQQKNIKLKLEFNESPMSAASASSSQHVLLINEDDEENQQNEQTKQIDPNNEEIMYHLWFYRFSINDCINCAFTFPFLISMSTHFDQIHSDIFTYVSWENCDYSY